MQKFIGLLLFFSFIYNGLNGQDSLSQQTDSLFIQTSPKKNKKKKWLKRYFQDDYPSPKKAVILAIIPGMGQVYNKKIWKLPLVYGALGGVIFAIKFNTDQFNIFQKSLDIRNNVDPICQTNPTIEDCTEDSRVVNIPTAAVVARRNNFDKNRQLSWIGVMGFYLISAGDALVDAHLKDFSVDDDISLVPIFEPNYANQATVGVGLRFNLSK